MSARNLHRLSGAIAALAREALAGPCTLTSCDEPAAGYIQGTSNHPAGICERHIPGAEAHGYIVHREAPTG